MAGKFRKIPKIIPGKYHEGIVPNLGPSQYEEGPGSRGKEHGAASRLHTAESYNRTGEEIISPKEITVFPHSVVYKNRRYRILVERTEYGGYDYYAHELDDKGNFVSTHMPEISSSGEEWDSPEEAIKQAQNHIKRVINEESD